MKRDRKELVPDSEESRKQRHPALDESQVVSDTTEASPTKRARLDGLPSDSATSPLPPFPSTSDCDITPALGAPEAPAKESPLSSPDFQVQILACNGTHKGQSRAPPASVRRPRPSESTDESSFWRRSAAKSTYAESSEEEVQDSGDEFVFEEKRQQQPARGKGVKGRTHGKGRASVAPKRSTGGKKLTSSSAGNNGAKVLKSSASMPDLKSRRNELARTDSQTSLFSTISATPSKMSGKARSLDVDPAEGDWVEPTEPLVWIFVWTQTQQLETTQHNAKAGFWWPAELQWDSECDMPEIPFVAKLYIDDDREILKYSHEEIQIDSPSQTNILPFKFSVGGARCDVFNYRRNLPHQSARGISEELPQTVAEASTSTASHHLPAPTEIPAPSTTAFKSATKKAYERDTELNGGLPDPSIIQDSLQASPVKVKRKSAFELALEHETKNGEKWCTSENHLEPVHPRMEIPGQLGMARIKWRGKQEWYPGKLERVELPKPVKEGGEWRTEASRKADFFVQLPFKEEKTLRKLKPHDFVPLFSTDTLCEIEATGFVSEPNISPDQAVNRLTEHLDAMQKVINGEDPISLDMHQQFFQWTSLQREKASLTHVHAFGDWHENLIYAIQEFLEAWSKKEQVGSRSAPPRGPGEEMFEALSPVDKRYYCELVLRPMALRLLTLDDEPRYLEQARAAHPDDEIAALKMAHQAATDHLSSLGWVTRIMIDWRAGKDARKRETERRAKETAREEAKMGL